MGHRERELKCAKMLKKFGYLESCSSRNMKLSPFVGAVNPQYWISDRDPFVTCPLRKLLHRNEERME